MICKFKPASGTREIIIDTDNLQPLEERDGSFTTMFRQTKVDLLLVGRDKMHGHDLEVFDTQTAGGGVCCYILRIDGEFKYYAASKSALNHMFNTFVDYNQPVVGNTVIRNDIKHEYTIQAHTSAWVYLRGIEKHDTVFGVKIEEFEKYYHRKGEAVQIGTPTS